MALCALPRFHSEYLSCFLRVVNLDTRVKINKQHDVCILPLSELHNKVSSLDIEPGTA